MIRGSVSTPNLEDARGADKWYRGKHMRHIAVVGVLFVAMGAQNRFAQPSAAQLAAPRPVMPFVDWGACPFEGCQYQVNWTALQAVTVIDQAPFPWRPWNGRPGKPVFTIQPGDEVLALDGVVFFLSPGRVRIDREMQVRIQAPSFPNMVRTTMLVPGDIVYLLTYHGEGAATAWFKNELIDFDLIGFEGFGTCRGCVHQGEVLERGRSEWWVKVRNSEGKVGWTDRTDDFSGKDRYE